MVWSLLEPSEALARAIQTLDPCSIDVHSIHRSSYDGNVSFSSCSVSCTWIASQSYLARIVLSTIARDSVFGRRGSHVRPAMPDVARLPHKSASVRRPTLRHTHVPPLLSILSAYPTVLCSVHRRGSWGSGSPYPTPLVQHRETSQGRTEAGVVGRKSIHGRIGGGASGGSASQPPPLARC